MYRIRFHGRGGQGIKTAGQVLGTAFFLAGWEVQDAPRYGAERRGAPIFSYVRAARSPIAERGVIGHPNLVVVADQTLVGVPSAGILEDVGRTSLLLLCTAEDAATWQARLALPCPVLTFRTRRGAIADGAGAELGAACAGAAARLVGVIPRETLESALHEEYAKLGAAGAGCIDAALAAFDALSAHAGAAVPTVEPGAGEAPAPAWVELPLDEAAVAAPDIHAPLTSERVNTGAWRTHTPVIDRDRCNRCSWICSTFCPDSAISVSDDRRPHIDLDHCKGCLVCVAVCPPHAIDAVPVATRLGDRA